jgi:antibiotic biosynthesis monooxygenase (ABM) superfamily enzyme
MIAIMLWGYRNNLRSCYYLLKQIKCGNVVIVDLPTEVTTVICRKIKPGHEKDYNYWIRRYLELERKAPGYLGTTIIIAGGSKSPFRYIIRRFTDKAAMEAWDNSEESLKLIEEANNYSIRHYETSTGLETWFTLPELKTLTQSPPPRWKMAIVIFFAAYAISSVSRYILGPLIGQWPLYTNAVIFTGILVVSLTYFALPIANRVLRRWLYPGSV